MDYVLKMNKKSGIIVWVLWLMIFRGIKQLKQGTSARKGRLMHLNSTLRNCFCCLEFFVGVKSWMLTKNVFAFIFNKIPITAYWSLQRSVVCAMKGEFFCGLWALRELILSVVSSTEMVQCIYQWRTLPWKNEPSMYEPECCLGPTIRIRWCQPFLELALLLNSLF